MKFASVVIDQDAKAIDREFEYKIPDDLDLTLGERVLVVNARNRFRLCS